MCIVPPAELGGTKANLVTDIQSYEQLKQKKLRMFRSAHGSLYLLYSQERGGGGVIPLFFPFHYNTSSELDEIPLKGNALGGEYTKCLRGTKRDIVILSTMDSMAAAGSYKHIRERQ